MSLVPRLELRALFLIVGVGLVSFLISCPLQSYLFCFSGNCQSSLMPCDASWGQTFEVVPAQNQNLESSMRVGKAKEIQLLPHEPFKSNGLLHFDRLPIRKRGFSVRQASSYDWSGRNQDFNHFISMKDNYLRIFEDYGAGCILRSYIIFTSGSDREIGVLWDVLVEVDGELVFNRTLREMSTGAHGPYYFPLAGLNEIRHGYFHYVPIFYKKSCIITIDTKKYRYPTKEDPRTYFGQGLYYTFTHHKYNFIAGNDDPKTFRGDEEDVDGLMNTMYKSLLGPLPPQLSTLPVSTSLKSEKYPVEKGQSKIVSYDGAGAIIGFRIHVRRETRMKYKKLRLIVRFDDAATPQIDVPLGLFFSSETGDYPTRSIAVGFKPKLGGYCHFPMPFWSGFVVIVENEFGKAITIDYEFNVSSVVYPKEETGYFHATWHGEAPYKKGTDFPMFQDEGRWGHVVGVTLITRRNIDIDEPYPFEGDERFYIDDKTTVAVHGTGTEDYFNTGHHFDRLHNFSLPFHGNPYYWKLSPEKYDIHTYRLLIQDFLPYQNSISMGMETSPWITGKTTADYTAIAYHYSGTKPGMKQTDEFNVGDKEAEAEHKYSCEGCEPSGEINDNYEALLANDPRIVDSGYNIKKSSRFQVKIAKEASGVLLRRRLDHNYQNQKAKVFVDGAEVGIWFEPKKNPFYAFRNSDFWIPQSFTKGKTQLSIRIEVIYQGSKEGESDIWSELHYWVFCEV